MKNQFPTVPLHRSAMEHAQEAVLTQDPLRARELFRSAFELERRAAELWAETYGEEPTRSVLYRSAASLARDCCDYAEAERLVRKGLAGRPPGTIARQLEELLDLVYQEAPSLKARQEPHPSHRRRSVGK